MDLLAPLTSGTPWYYVSAGQLFGLAKVLALELTVLEITMMVLVPKIPPGSY